MTEPPNSSEEPREQGVHYHQDDGTLSSAGPSDHVVAVLTGDVDSPLRTIGDSRHWPGTTQTIGIIDALGDLGSLIPGLRSSSQSPLVLGITSAGLSDLSTAVAGPEYEAATRGRSGIDGLATAFGSELHRDVEIHVIPADE